MSDQEDLNFEGIEKAAFSAFYREGLSGLFHVCHS